MTRRSITGAVYPPDWKAISQRVRGEAGWHCIRCDHPHDPAAGRTLTCHHLDMDPGNNVWWNLLALCQRCHLSVQARVDLARPWVMADHSPWFRLYAGGWYAWRYEGRLITRTEAEADLERLLGLERAAVLGAEAVR